MPSTYSPSLKLELIGTGEQAGTWGVTTNNNLGTLLEQAITGVVTLNMGDANYTMTNYNGLSDEARNAVLVLNGPITSPQNLIAPPQQKVYIVRNFTGNTVTIRTATGNGVALTNAASAVVFCDGTDFYSATTLNYIDGNLTVTGNTNLYGSVSMANATNATVTIYANTVYGNVSSGQWYIPKGNTSVRTITPTEGLLRYNTELNVYEGFQNNTWVKFVTANENNYSVSYLIVAGGGAGQAALTNGTGGAGGGAGGVLAGSTTLISGATYTIIVGGAGSNSSFASQIAIRGGAAPGGNGGSGAGGFYTTSPGTGVLGQGNDGGASSITYGSQGGGGGAGTAGGAAGGAGAGGSPVTNYGGAGGSGASSAITGASYTYAGGGGGGSGFEGAGTGGAGGSGIGGNGGVTGGNPVGGNGLTSTGSGGGGGGGFGGAANAGGNGGSGIVILSIPTVSYTGLYTGSPTISTSGSNTILQYITSGTYTA